MSFKIEVNVFRDLIVKYPTWEDLQNFLESEEGGLFRVTDKDKNGFCLIRYEKGSTKMDLPHSKWFRSVVWNTTTNQPVCVAPPKVSDQDFNYKTLQDIKDAGIICQEQYEGFMINCFRIVGDTQLYITSRSKLNATGKFYSEKSFRKLFIEAYMNTTECSHNSEFTIQHLLHPDSSKNEVATFFSFLVQHKDHRIVKPNSANRVYLIHSGVVYNDGSVEIIDSPETVKDQLNIQNILLEQKQATGSYAMIASQANEINGEVTEVQKWIKMYMLNRDWTFQGLVFKDKYGNRWRFRSEKYGAIKTLRGNSSNISERFAQLYTQNLVSKYLEYYSEDLAPITVHMILMDVIVKMLYDNYVDIHITKTKKIDDIDKMFHPHLYSIHGIYLTHLRPNNKKINFDEIKVYLHKQPWQRIVFLIKKIIAITHE